MDDSGHSETSEDESLSETDTVIDKNDGQNMSMEEMMKLREKLGSKVFDKKFISRNKNKESGNSKDDNKQSGSNSTSKNFSRINKNRPQEVSSKRPVGRYSRRKGDQETRDPRFDEICGSKFNQDVFDARFSFLSDVRGKEKKILDKKFNRAKTSEEKRKIKLLLNRMNNQEREKLKRNEEKLVIQKWRKEEKGKVSQGKRPYFLKDSDKKKLIKEYRLQNPSNKVDKPKKSKRDQRKFSGQMESPASTV
ncbi:ribosomal RNA processing protein 36 homolog [Styela clava]